MNLLKIKDLSVRYKTKSDFIAVDKINFTIDANETLALVGESGSGKTTLALAIADFLPENSITSGSISFLGREIHNLKSKELRLFRKNNLGMIFQDPFSSLNPSMKIIHQLTEAIPNGTKKRKRQKALELLKIAGVSEPEIRLFQYPHELSGGLCQRVMIAIAIAATPLLLIADEPTSALDPSIQSQILKLFLEIKEKLNTTILLITHDLWVASVLSDKIGIMYGGKIVEMGKTKKVLSSPRHPYTKLLLDSLPSNLKQEHPEYEIPPFRTNGLCPFLPRCPKAFSLCKEKLPDKKEQDHFLMCWLAEENDA